jgi:hypothetical protein
MSSACAASGCGMPGKDVAELSEFCEIPPDGGETRAATENGSEPSTPTATPHDFW